MVGRPVMAQRRLVMGRALMVGHPQTRAIQVTGERARGRPNKS